MRAGHPLLFCFPGSSELVGCPVTNHLTTGYYNLLVSHGRAEKTQARLVIPGTLSLKRPTSYKLIKYS